MLIKLKGMKPSPEFNLKEKSTYFLDVCVLLSIFNHPFIIFNHLIIPEPVEKSLKIFRKLITNVLSPVCDYWAFFCLYQIKRK